jgi:GT2 family glycosyltransferase
MAPEPAVTAVLVNWNGRDWLPSVLGTLRDQRGVDLRIVVVDNASRDGSRTWLDNNASDATTIFSARNEGFAGGVNRGLAAVDTPWVLLINPDVTLAESYLATVIQQMAHNQHIASATGTLVLPDGRIDSTGHVAYRNGWAGNRDHGVPLDALQRRSPNEVFGVCAAAAVYRTEALRDVELAGDGVLGEVFFAYLEDVDLDWRLRWRGWSALHVPEALATHHRSGTGARLRPFVRRHIIKNYPALLTREYPTQWLARDAAEILLMALLMTAMYCSASPSALLGFADFLRLLPRLLEQRRRIRLRRRVSAAEIRRWMQPYPYADKSRRGMAKARARTA